MVLGKLALGSDALASWNPEVAEDTAGVEESHGSDGEDDHGTLEDHEGDFVVGKLAVETVPELGDTVDASDEDENCGGEETLMMLVWTM